VSAPVQAAAAAALLVLAAGLTQDVKPNGSEAPWTPKVAAASEEAKLALQRVKLPKGYTASLFAAEPRVANPVSFCVDASGVVYVAETFRLKDGVTDIRDHVDWTDDDLASRTVEDRVELMRKHLGEKFPEMSRTFDRVKWIADLDGDGVADADKVLDDGFRTAATGVGSGVLSRKGSVYYTCIPDLWLLGDAKRDGSLTSRKSLHHGFGIHIAMIGHDLHGLKIGPDGRLYFSCGDRGFNVKTPEGPIEHTHAGAVLRCELDGSGLEVYATGLRNPQELAFDELGNLFTGDNNCDGGDRARWVHVLDGGDSGYRYGYQWMDEPYLRGPWNDEKLWHPRFDGQAAYIVPPVSWLGAGPAGIAYDPGIGLDAENRGRFFTCDFEGDPKRSSILRFTVKPKGASFELGAVDKFLTGALPTDVEFGPDGALYWLDWVSGWDTTGKGRIFKVVHESSAGDPAAARAAALLKEGKEARPVSELALLLTFADQRVRQEAQFELTARGAEGAAALAAAARGPGAVLTRFHGIWGLAMAERLGRVPPLLDAREVLRALLSDADAEVRAQAAKACGELRDGAAVKSLTSLLGDASARVKMHAAAALGRIGAPGAVEALFEVAREAGERDPALRHAAIAGLAGCASGEALAAALDDKSVDARVAAVVALRRRRDPFVERFLADGNPRVVAEAARAVYDLPIAPSLPRLAEWIDGLELDKAGAAPSAAYSEAALRRALAAALRLGGRRNAERLARVAAAKNVDDRMRATALDHLTRFVDTPRRDPICGEWRPFPRTAEEAAEGKTAASAAVLETAGKGLDEASEPVASAWLELAERFGVKDAAPRAVAFYADAQRPPALRARAVRTLGVLSPPDLGEHLTRALADPSAEVRVAALEAIRRAIPAKTFDAAKSALASGTLAELRFAYAALADVKSDDAATILRAELDRLEGGLVPQEARQELVAAALKALGAEALDALPSRAAAARLDPALTPWLDSLYGGNASRGRALFRSSAALSCLRCHRADGGDGGLVGPDLRGVGGRATRLQLLEAIVDPNRRVTGGYEGAAVELKGGGLLTGRVEREADGKLFLRKADDTVAEISLDDVAGRRADLSAMPEGLGKYLTPLEMRDLIEFLATVK
jgi:quinoprotein glucose dehydrogenase